MTGSDLSHHNREDYRCVHWVGDQPFNSPVARCRVCAQPGYREAYDQQQRRQMLDQVGLLLLLGAIGFFLALVFTSGR